MTTVSVNVDPPLEVKRLTLDSGGSFFVIRCNSEASIILPGLDHEAIAQARSLVRALNSAIVALSESLTPEDVEMPS